MRTLFRIIRKKRNPIEKKNKEKIKKKCPGEKKKPPPWSLHRPKGKNKKKRKCTDFFGKQVKRIQIKRC